MLQEAPLGAWVAPEKPRCAVCGADARATCARCGEVRFKDKACQKKFWRGLAGVAPHRDWCVAPEDREDEAAKFAKQLRTGVVLDPKLIYGHGVYAACSVKSPRRGAVTTPRGAAFVHPRATFIFRATQAACVDRGLHDILLVRLEDGAPAERAPGSASTHAAHGAGPRLGGRVVVELQAAGRQRKDLPVRERGARRHGEGRRRRGAGGAEAAARGHGGGGRVRARGLHRGGRGVQPPARGGGPAGVRLAPALPPGRAREAAGGD